MASLGQFQPSSLPDISSSERPPLALEQSFAIQWRAAAVHCKAAVRTALFRVSRTSGIDPERRYVEYREVSDTMTEKLEEKKASKIPGRLVVTAFALLIVWAVSALGSIAAMGGQGRLARILADISSLAGYLVVPVLIVAVVAALAIKGSSKHSD